MPWEDIISDPEFQKQPDEVKRRVASNYFKANIASDPEFQAQPMEVQDRVVSNFNQTLYPVDTAKAQVKKPIEFVEPDKWEPLKETGKAILQDLGRNIMGAGEGVLAAGTQLSSTLSGVPGIAGITRGIRAMADREPDVLGKATEAIQKASAATTYTPTTEEGKGLARILGLPFEALGWAAESAGKSVGDITKTATGSEQAANFAQTITTIAGELSVFALPLLKKIPSPNVKQFVNNIKNAETYQKAQDAYYRMTVKERALVVQAIEEAAAKRDAVKSRIAETMREKGASESAIEAKMARMFPEEFKKSLEKRMAEKPVEEVLPSDTQNIAGVSGEVGVGEKLVQAEPVKSTSGEAVKASGILQAQGEVTPDFQPLISEAETLGARFEGIDEITGGRPMFTDMADTKSTFMVRPDETVAQALERIRTPFREAVEQIKPAVEPVEPAQKEPWQMTREEFFNALPDIKEKLNHVAEMQDEEFKGGFNADYDYEQVLRRGESGEYDVYLTKQRPYKSEKPILPNKYFKQPIATFDNAQEAVMFLATNATLGHKAKLTQAISEGKPVPPEVLADYPELQKRTDILTETAAQKDVAATPPQPGLSVRNVAGMPMSDIEQVALSDAEAEQNFQESKNIPKPSIAARIGESVSSTAKMMRPYPELDISDPRQAWLRDALRRIENLPDYADAVSTDVVTGITRKLTPNRQDVFDKYMFMNNVLMDVEAGKYMTESGVSKELPNKLTMETLQTEIPRLKQVIDADPVLSEALASRTKFIEGFTKQIVEAGIFPEDFVSDPRYLHKIVLEYVDRVGMSGKKIPAGIAGFQMRRVGSGKDALTNYAIAEKFFISDALQQIEKENIWRGFEERFDVKGELKEEAVRRATENMPAGIDPEIKKQVERDARRDWKNLLSLPEFQHLTIIKKRDLKGFSWQSRIVESTLDEVLNDMMESPELADEATKKAMRIIAAKVRNTLDANMVVVPKNVAQALRDFDASHHTSETLPTILHDTWKQHVLLNPFRLTKYSINNAFGDADAMLIYPETIKEILDATMEVFNFSYSGKAMTEDLRNTMRYGVLQGQSAIEIKGLDEGGIGKRVPILNEIPFLRGWYNFARKLNLVREAIPRLAAYKYALKRFKAGDVLYGATPRQIMDALTTPEEKAARFAVDLIGNYNDISAFGKGLAKNWVPFYRWQEMNPKRYYHLVNNIPFETGGSKEKAAQVAAAAIGRRTAYTAAKNTARIALGAAMMPLITTAANEIMKRILNVSDDEMDKLERDRSQYHILLGRDADGELFTIRATGALGDVFNWVKMSHPVEMAVHLAKGKKSGKTPEEKLKDMGRAAVSRVANSFRPELKIPFELASGKTLYPDVTQPRAIRDKWEHALRALSLDPIYKFYTQPMKGEDMPGKIRNILLGAVVYKSNPGENAYYEIKEHEARFLKRYGKDVNIEPKEKSDALYYYKKAVRENDKEMQKVWLKKYGELGGTRGGISKSLQKSQPGGQIPNALRGEFIKSLTPELKSSFKMAQKWYREVY